MHNYAVPASSKPYIYDTVSTSQSEHDRILQQKYSTSLLTKQQKDFLHKIMRFINKGKYPLTDFCSSQRR